MSDPKWTPEQLARRLRVGRSRNRRVLVVDIINSEGTEIGRLCPRRDGVEEEVERLVECWNACTGIAHPEAIKQVVEAAQALYTAGRAYMEYHSRKYAENDMVVPTGITPVLDKMEAALAALEGRDDG